MKVRIVHRPSGLINGQYWPKVGETIELPDGVAVGMLNAKQVEPAGDDPEETRPADTSDVEISKPVDTGKVETSTPSDAGKEGASTPEADTGKVETAAPRKGRASAAAAPVTDVKSDAGTSGDAPVGKA